MSESWPLRPCLADDALILREVLAASVEELMQDDYDDDQRAAWVAFAEDEEEFAERLADQLTLVVEVDGEHLGFASLKDNTTIDMLYVHPNYVGQGIGTALIDALEKIARSRGTKSITVEASETAQMFFEERGYVASRRTMQPVEGEMLAVTAMSKALKP